MLEYPIHGSFHSFLVAKRKGVLSGDNQYWPGWTQRHIERNVAEVTIMRVVRGYEYESQDGAKHINLISSLDTYMSKVQIEITKGMRETIYTMDIVMLDATESI